MLESELKVINEEYRSSSTQSLGDRMKDYENAEVTPYLIENGDYVLNPEQPFMARIDGHCFSKFTKGFEKPFDAIFSTAMTRTTGDLVDEFNARTGYTQSDEITLVFVPVYNEETSSWGQWPFRGRVVKLSTLMASYAGVRFNYHLVHLLQEALNSAIDDDGEEESRSTEPFKYSEGVIKKIMSQRAHFDARLFSVPNEREVFNNILWRSTYDCVRNSISGLARRHYSTKQLHKKNTTEMKEMLLDKGVDWDQMPAAFRWGSFIKREKYTKEGTDYATGEKIEVTRSRIRVWSRELKGYDADFASLLTAKWA